MTQLEIVLNGIDEVRNSGIQCPLENVEPRRCVYFPESLIDEIVSLLKAQEPRLLTIQEVNERKWDYCYFERLLHENYGPDFRKNKYWTEIACETEHFMSEWIKHYGYDDYGKTWRCWTSRPTDEQREAMPWG